MEHVQTLLPLSRHFAARCRRRRPERLNLPFLRYIWNYNRVTLPRVQAALEAAPAGCRIIRLASPAATAAFLKRFS